MANRYYEGDKNRARAEMFRAKAGQDRYLQQQRARAEKELQDEQDAQAGDWLSKAGMGAATGMMMGNPLAGALVGGGVGLLGATAHNMRKGQNPLEALVGGIGGGFKHMDRTADTMMGLAPQMAMSYAMQQGRAGDGVDSALAGAKRADQQRSLADTAYQGRLGSDVYDDSTLQDYGDVRLKEEDPFAWSQK